MSSVRISLSSSVRIVNEKKLANHSLRCILHEIALRQENSNVMKTVSGMFIYCYGLFEPVKLYLSERYRICCFHSFICIWLPTNQETVCNSGVVVPGEVGICIIYPPGVNYSLV